MKKAKKNEAKKPIFRYLYPGRQNISNFHINPFTMNKNSSGLVYFLLGIYALMISWHYNHNVILLIVHYIFWPIYLVYELLTGNLSNGMWRTIPESYFK